MNFAIDPITSERITAAEFRKKYGVRTTNGLTPPAAICPYCKQSLSLRQGTKILHFWHGTDSAFCPSKTPFGQPYINLTPAQPNPLNAAQLRHQFKAQWMLHYQELQRLMSNMLHYKEFLQLLDDAVKKDLFAYTGMTIIDVPYVLILARDYPPKAGLLKNGVPVRKFWFRFWYDTSIRRIEDLWIHGPATATLIRASFNPPVPPAKFPEYDVDLIADKPMSRQNFLTIPPPILPKWLIDEVEKWFSRHPSF